MPWLRTPLRPCTVSPSSLKIGRMLLALFKGTPKEIEALVWDSIFLLKRAPPVSIGDSPTQGAGEGGCLSQTQVISCLRVPTRNNYSPCDFSIETAIPPIARRKAHFSQRDTV